MGKKTKVGSLTWSGCNKRGAETYAKKMRKKGYNAKIIRRNLPYGTHVYAKHMYDVYTKKKGILARIKKKRK